MSSVLRKAVIAVLLVAGAVLMTLLGQSGSPSGGTGGLGPNPHPTPSPGAAWVVPAPSATPGFDGSCDVAPKAPTAEVMHVVGVNATMVCQWELDHGWHTTAAVAPGVPQVCGMLAGPGIALISVYDTGAAADGINTCLGLVYAGWRETKDWPLVQQAEVSPPPGFFTPGKPGLGLPTEYFG